MSENQPFDLVTNYQPAGDQPQAIEKLVKGIDQGFRNQLLLGVTGSGKTYTMANVIDAHKWLHVDHVYQPRSGFVGIRVYGTFPGICFHR